MSTDMASSFPRPIGQYALEKEGVSARSAISGWGEPGAGKAKSGAFFGLPGIPGIPPSEISDGTFGFEDRNSLCDVGRRGSKRIAHLYHFNDTRI